MTRPGRSVIGSPDKSGRGNLLARYLHTSFRYRGGRLTLRPQEERIARVCQARLISGSGGRGKVEPPPFPLLPFVIARSDAEAASEAWQDEAIS